jgi:hypothetical protein
MRGGPFRLSFAALLVLALAVCCTRATFAKVQVSTPLSTHVLNVTLNAPGWPTDGTALSNYVSSLTTRVNATICGSLPSTVTQCGAFMMAVSSSSSRVQVAVQASAHTASYSAGNETYTLFSQWAAGTNLFSLSALAGTLSTPTFSSGTYTVPCRGTQTYAFLPACAAAETPSTTVYVRSTSSNLQTTFLSYLCPGTSISVCNATVTVTSAADNYQMVIISGTSKGLEAVLAFVADARASYRGVIASAASAAPGEVVGDSSKQLSVTAVELRYRALRAPLFSTTENERTYMSDINLSLQCEPSYSMWAITFVVIPFLAIGLFRYVWYRGRRRAKKHERRRIVEDETRIMQGYTNPAGTQAAETAPPPGVDTSAAAPQWVMDENGNYYDANSTAAATAAADGGNPNNNSGPPLGTGGANDVMYQTWVDPETGETYQYVVDTSATGADATQQQQQQSSGGAVSKAAAAAAAAGNANVTYQTYVDPETGETYQYMVDNSAEAAGTGSAQDASQGGKAGAAGDGSVTYQTYVDPETGETYQYATDNSAADGGAATAVDDSAKQAAEAGGDEGNVTYQTYVDPETGETYQYAVSPASNTPQEEPTAQEAHTTAAARADGYQTYVDPNTGETYQYATTGDGVAEGQQYEYVDPDTGETYMYDAPAAQGGGAADAAAEGGGDGGATINTYVDPNTGETYQYEADPNGGDAYEYVDPETGETYQYQNPAAGQ